LINHIEDFHLKIMMICQSGFQKMRKSITLKNYQSLN